MVLILFFFFERFNLGYLMEDENKGRLFILQRRQTFILFLILSVQYAMVLQHGGVKANSSK